jgi:hypothetical protein
MKMSQVAVMCGLLGWLAVIAPTAQGQYTASYSNISPDLIILGTGDTTTNWLDAGALTNWPARFYQIKLVP